MTAGGGPRVPDPLVTPRLLGRRPRSTDIDRLDELLNDSAVARTMGGHRSPEAIRAILRRHIDAWDRDGFASWMLFSRATGEFVGRGGLHAAAVLGRAEVEIGYALRPAFWGAGFATEIAGTAADLAFEALGCDSVIGLTLIDNVASRHVLEKCGLTYERHVMHADLSHVLLRRRRSDPRPSATAAVG